MNTQNVNTYTAVVSLPARQTNQWHCYKGYTYCYFDQPYPRLITLNGILKINHFSYLLSFKMHTRHISWALPIYLLVGAFWTVEKNHALDKTVLQI